MQRFFFDITDGADIRDDVGQLLPTLKDARIYAIFRGTDFMAKLDGAGLGGYIVITIRDATATLITLRLVCQIEVHETKEKSKAA